MITSAFRSATLERFQRQRETWSSNPALRRLYAYWYGEVRAALGERIAGSVVEIGSGAGFAKDFLPTLRTSDTVKADWHDYEIDATSRWPFEDGELDGIVVFDVLHHLASPRDFFREAERTLRADGCLVMMEPYVSPLSYPIYRFLHEEGLDTSVEPLETDTTGVDKDPFAGNQALPGLIFGRYGRQFASEFPGLKLSDCKLYSGISYMASGGFSRRCPLPLAAWRGLFWLDRHLPRNLHRLTAFRMLIVLQRER